MPGSECVILIFAVIVILATFGVIGFICKCSDNFTNLTKLKESFSPTGWTKNCPQPHPRAVSPDMALGEMTGPLNQWWNNIKKNNIKKTSKEHFGNKKQVIGKCGPGCVYKCKEGESCPNVEVTGCRRYERKPTLIENVPLGFGTTMSGPYSGPSGCASNVNGITRMGYGNPYGYTAPYGNQMYGFCEKGKPNPFNKNPYYGEYNPSSRFR